MAEPADLADARTPRAPRTEPTTEDAEVVLERLREDPELAASVAEAVRGVRGALFLGDDV